MTQNCVKANVANYWKQNYPKLLTSTYRFPKSFPDLRGLGPRRLRRGDSVTLLVPQNGWFVMMENPI